MLADVGGVRLGPATRIGQRQTAFKCLAPHKAKCESLALRQGCSDTSEFTHRLVFRKQRRAGRGHVAMQDKAGKGAVDIATRPDALHNLLPQVAALVEMQGPRLRRFLRQIPVTQVHTKARRTLRNAEQLHIRSGTAGYTGSEQRLVQGVDTVSFV